MTDRARHLGILLVALLILGIGGAKLLSQVGRDHRDYVSPALERRADATLGVLTKVCRKKKRPSRREARLFRRAADEYAALARREPDKFLHSDFADNAETTMRYTLFAWAQVAADGDCAGLDTEARALIRGALRLDERREQDMLHEALEAEADF
jgi:hypothetical protein